MAAPAPNSSRAESRGTEPEAPWETHEDEISVPNERSGGLFLCQVCFGERASHVPHTLKHLRLQESMQWEARGDGGGVRFWHGEIKSKAGRCESDD